MLSSICCRTTSPSPRREWLFLCLDLCFEDKNLLDRVNASLTHAVTVKTFKVKISFIVWSLDNRALLYYYFTGWPIGENLRCPLSPPLSISVNPYFIFTSFIISLVDKHEKYIPYE